MSDAIMLDVADATPVRLDVGDADPIAREEIAALAGRVTTVEGDVTALDGRMDAAEGAISALDGRMDAAEGEISTLGTTVDGIDARVEAIEADYVTAEDVMGALGGEAPALVAGSSRAVLGDAETASWMGRTTAADGAALIESVKGNTLVWNQLVGADTSTVTIPSGHKYHSVIGGTSAIATSDGTAISVTGGTDQLFDLTAMFGAGNEPATVAEFEALFPLPYYPYDAGSLLPVRMEGVETVGFNQWDEEWELGWVDNTGANRASSSNIRSKNYIPVFPNTQYYLKTPQVGVFVYFDADKNCLGNVDANGLRDIPIPGAVRTTPSNCRYIRFWLTSGTTYKHDICINISDPSRNGTYEPYWRSERAIPASTYFPDGMRSAGNVRDELTATEAITRVGVVDHTSDWRFAIGTVNSHGIGYVEIEANPSGNGSLADGATKITSNIHIGTTVFADSTEREFAFNGAKLFYRFPATEPVTLDAAIADMEAHGAVCFYELATPTTQAIDSPLPLSYRTGAGGTERVMVAEGTTSAPPVFVTRYPLDPADLAASIAPVDGPIAKTNHQVGDLLMLGFTLCKATQVIVTGETIAIGTNVTMTTVAAELAALSE